MRGNAQFAPFGDCVCMGIPFAVDRVVILNRKPVTAALPGVSAKWIVFMHTADVIERLRSDYYELQGWDSEGRPERALLEKMKIEKF